MFKLGLFGGTFNPIHLGHIKAASEIIGKLNLNKICFIPSYMPPHKKPIKLTSSDHRLNMIESALENSKNLCVSDYEIRKEDISYTINTLSFFKKKYRNTELFFIVGNDIFNTIETWKDYRSLFELSNFIVMIRPGFSEEFDHLPVALKEVFRYYESDSEKIIYKHKSLKLLIKLKIKGLEISSSEIRQLVYSSKSVNNLVPPEVEKYILKYKLYHEGVTR